MIQYYIITIIFMFISLYNRIYIYNMYTKAIFLNQIRKNNNISLVSGLNSSFYMIYMYITLNITMFLQKHVNNWCIKEVEKNLYEVHLMIRGKRAKILVKMNRDPSDILFVSDDVGNDITMEVVPYRNYKYIDCTPEILGCKQIEIIDISGSTQRFCGDTSIN